MSDTAEMADTIRIHARLLDALLAEARRDPGIECCGLLAGATASSRPCCPRARPGQRHPHEIAPDDLFAFFRGMRERGLDHLGIYHSHPATGNAPSPTDIERAYYPDVAHFIISPRADAQKPVRAFRIVEGRAAELVIEWV
jgi:proteasome lid subunit RPN8/RPN11